MATSPAAQASPRIPWLYLGGVLMLLIGFGVSYFGGFFFNGGRNHVPPADKLPYVGLVVLGIAVFALGGFLLASIDQVRGADMSLLCITLLMVPVPSLAALLFNFVGNYLRRTRSANVQIILVAAGIFLLGLAGNWAWSIHQSGVVRASFQAFVWPVLADFGAVSLVLAALPALIQPEHVGAPATLQANENHV
jgi:hypothetical protein